MSTRCFDALLSDEEMRVHLSCGEMLSFKLQKWHTIERQIERLGFDDLYFVTEVDSERGTLIKVTPTAAPEFLRHA